MNCVYRFSYFKAHYVFVPQLFFLFLGDPLDHDIIFERSWKIVTVKRPHYNPIEFADVVRTQRKYEAR